MDNKEIVFVMPSIVGGGAERVISILANYFSELNYKTTILLIKDDIIEYKINPKVKIDTSLLEEKTNFIVFVKRILRLRKYFKKHKGCHVISFLNHLNLFVLLSAIGLPNKVIVSERIDPKHSIADYKIVHIARNILYGTAKNIIFQTNDALEYFPRTIQKKGIIIPNPLIDELPEKYYGKRKKEIVAFSRLEKQKNIPMIIEAFSMFTKEFPEYSLSIYGKGSMEQELKEKVKILELEKKIIFKGFEKNIHKKIYDSSMYLSSSDYEGLSNSMLEAMAIGLPCICTDCPPGGARMFIKHRRNGMLIPVGDANAMFLAMKELVQNEELANSISEQSVKIRGELTKGNICNQWKKVIDV